MDRDKLFAISQLISATTAIRIAYNQLGKIPNKDVLFIKLELGEKIRELRDLEKRATQIAFSINEEEQNGT